jgi:hypothetical protein
MAFISEVHFRGTGVAASGEFVEITLGPDDDPSDFVVSVYDDDGTLHTNAGIVGGEVNLGTLTGIAHPDNPDFTIYVISVGIRNAASDGDEGSGIALTNVDTDTVISFYSADNIAAFDATEGAADGATSESILEHTDVEIGESFQWDIYGNLTYETIGADASVLCLAGEVLVRTEHGDVRAEDLNVGDMVWTADHGFEPVKWVGKTKLSAEYLAQHPKQQPIKLAKDSLAPGMPQSDLAVSRQHRVLVASPVAKRMTGEFEVLVPAVKMLDVAGVELSTPDNGITYVHILFERHEVILAEGALVESLMLTDYVHSMASGLAQSQSTCCGPARLVVEGGMAKRLMARIVKNKRPVYEPQTLYGSGAEAA